jgi:tRNA-2-methylthio-N6-dimethylallyladenosine synthase
MNFSDTEIVLSILKEYGHTSCTDVNDADAIFFNTCSIRDHAEQRVMNRLQAIKSLKKKKPSLVIGVLGCMAERMKEQLLEERDFIDLIVGPDAYRDLPNLLNVVSLGRKGINVLLSTEETYADITPVRPGEDGVTAFISIMRGCQNYCAYCVVPYTRGEERSRDPKTILKEAAELFQSGYRDITLLGQNVNSYSWQSQGFPDLIGRVAEMSGELRIRFATSHPKDISDELIETIASHPNLCRSIHLPLQSGSDRILSLMKRKYTRDYYLDRIDTIRRMIPDCSITTDIIAGFCTETEADHTDTLELMHRVQFDYAFMFKYSERPDTFAAKNYRDDVEEEVKSRRLTEIIDLQQRLSLESNRRDIGKVFNVLVEKRSKRSKQELSGRNSQNKMIVFPDTGERPGEYVDVRIKKCTAATLIGEAIK